MQQLRILIADDTDSFRKLVSEVVGAFHQVTEVNTFQDASCLIEDTSREFHIAILDKHFPDGDGLNLIRAARTYRPELGIIMLTADNDVKSVNSSLDAGAHDYVIKSGYAVADLIVRIQMVINRLASDTKMKRLARVAEDCFRHELVGRSPYIAELRSKIAGQKGTLSPVLICGESGTGKELIARRLHAIESDLTRPFVAINCGAIPATLIESELFGHEKGAFTGANQRKVGKFELADGGDLFLDEIGELPEQTQASLLRVLQDGEVTRVGGTQAKKVKVRIIAATNRQLDAEVTRGRFRKDLYYRLSVIRYETKSLRERPEDIEPLVEFSIAQKRHAIPIGKDALRVLRSHRWPGNIRELQNTIERAQLSAKMRDSAGITAEDIRFDPAPGDVDSTGDTQSLLPFDIEDLSPDSFLKSKKEFDRRYLIRALTLCDGNVALASRMLGLGRSTMFVKMNELGIRRNDFDRVANAEQSEVIL